jgi:hypothetical protein
MLYQVITTKKQRTVPQIIQTTTFSKKIKNKKNNYNYIVVANNQSMKQNHTSLTKGQVVYKHLQDTSANPGERTRGDRDLHPMAMRRKMTGLTPWSGTNHTGLDFSGPDLSQSLE